MTRTAVLVLLATQVGACLAYAQPPPQADFRLDLVPHRHLPRVERMDVTPQPVLPHNGPRPELALTLLPLAHADFLWGDEFEYEVLVRNIGTVPVWLPWTSDGLVPVRPRVASLPEVRRATVRLEVWSIDGKQRLGGLQSHALAGAVDIQGTLQRLAPNQTALLRVPGRWHSHAAGEIPTILAQSNGEVRLSALLGVYEQSVVARSDNAVLATVRRPSR
jgi:hypothetical protein